MKIELSRRIGRDIDAVWEAVTDPERLQSWQPTLKSVRPVTGRRDAPGAVCEFVYDENGREVQLEETIREAERPGLLVAHYRGGGAETLVSNRFYMPTPGQTRWTVVCEVRFNGLLRRLLTPFSRGPIRTRIDGEMARLQKLLERPEESP